MCTGLCALDISCGGVRDGLEAALVQRIAEVLVSAVTPFQLLMGKLLAAVLVSFTLAVIYLGGLLVFVHTFDMVPPAVAVVRWPVWPSHGPAQAFSI